MPVLYLAAEDDDNGGYDFSDDAREMYAATAAADKRLQVLLGTPARRRPRRRLGAGADADRRLLKAH